MKQGMFAKKSIQTLLADAASGGQGLQKTLGAFHLVALGIGAIIGAGFFVLTGEAAANYAGPGVILSFVIAALICIFAAFCYAEFASLIPIAGSAYSYAYVTMGELVAWTIGWGLTLEYLFSAATVAVGWSGYFVSLVSDFGIAVPALVAQPPFAYDPAMGWQLTGSVINLPAIIVVGAIGLMVAIGTQTASFINNVLVVVKLAVIALFALFGAFFMDWSNLTPFIPENTGVFGQFGWSGIARAAGLIFFAFIGFDSVSTMAQEAKNPQRDLPIGTIGSLVISTIVYIIVAVILLGVVGYQSLGVPDPLAIAVNAFGPGFAWLRYVIKIAIVFGLSSVILVMLLGQARIFYSMANDRLLPPIFGKIHPKYKTPFFNTILITVIAVVLAGLFPTSILGQITSMGALLAFAIVSLGVMILRKTQPELHRPFKVPFVPWIPILSVALCVLQMLALSGVVWIQLVCWMAIGYGIYFFYGAKHSLARNRKG